VADLAAWKKDVRGRILAARATLDAETLATRATALCSRIDDFARQQDAKTVTVYASVGSEPGTREALRRLHDRGTRVLLPVLLPDLDLDWADYSPGDWRASRMSLVEPTSANLGVEAIGAADVVFCPGVAGDLEGRRLGRGGHCYDRALARARPDALRVLVAYDENVLDEVPADENDEFVDYLLTPTRLLRTRHSRD
jgi:5-formyltetrahydrofolate cyclo-ligase